MNLYERSIEMILTHQASSGAYIASPNFPSYAYSWLRDGSFIAYSMDIAGQHESARSFFNWANDTILRHAWKVENTLTRLNAGEVLDNGDYLHTRYTLEGEETQAEWQNFQLDGYGTWLWALGEHLSPTQNRPQADLFQGSVDLILRYLVAVWQQPNYDCWEEFSEFLHPHTLAAVYAGLLVGSELVDGEVSVRAKSIAYDIKRFVLERGISEGILRKAISLDAHLEPPIGVDASLIGIAHPYQLLDLDDPITKATIDKIEADLKRPGGGVYRYRSDTYFGGGEWILLASWLGWYYTESGERPKAVELLAWVEAQADADGYLPEQVSDHLLAPSCYQEWEERWGPVANPLLWSHAMYIILRHALDDLDDE